MKHTQSLATLPGAPGARASLFLGSLFVLGACVGCERDDKAKTGGPATQPAPAAAVGPATQPAGEGAASTGGLSSGGVSPGAATPGPGAPGTGAPRAGSPRAESPGAESPGAESPGAESPGAAAARDPGTRPANPQAGAPGDTYVMEENPEMKGRFGRVQVQFPEGSKADASIRLFKAGEQSPVQSTYSKLSADLLPGTYDVEVQNVRINGVQVKSKYNSRIRVGVLKTTAESGTGIKVLTADGKEAFNGYGSKSIGLPIGKYTVQVSGQGEEVTVKDGEVVEF